MAPLQLGAFSFLFKHKTSAGVLHTTFPVGYYSGNDAGIGNRKGVSKNMVTSRQILTAISAVTYNSDAQAGNASKNGDYRIVNLLCCQSILQFLTSVEFAMGTKEQFSTVRVRFSFKSNVSHSVDEVVNK